MKSSGQLEKRSPKLKKKAKGVLPPACKIVAFAHKMLSQFFPKQPKMLDNTFLQNSSVC